ncbi:MAG: inorganic diphosphatase [Candidatus Pacebacteria bacterium]|nr:inorganic diphosphatase [Candidatus Paceibacterota bacterium]
MNLWHDIDPGTSENITTIIEINKGSKNKYELDKKTGLIKLDRAMHTAQDYPFDYGLVPQTLWDDGDPLDVAVLTTYPLFPGVMVHVRPVAIMNMVDSGESDAKIIAVPNEDPRFDHVKDVTDINKHTLKEIEHFFLTYKKLQNKEVTIHGIEGADAAKRAFEKSLKLYQEKYPKK